jgi:hypothetical protein
VEKITAKAQRTPRMMGMDEQDGVPATSEPSAVASWLPSCLGALALKTERRDSGCGWSILWPCGDDSQYHGTDDKHEDRQFGEHKHGFNEQTGGR